MKISLICLGIYVLLITITLLRAIYYSLHKDTEKLKDLPFVRGLQNLHSASSKAIDTIRNPNRGEKDNYAELAKMVDSIDKSDRE